jgi:hypothetical protein
MNFPELGRIVPEYRNDCIREIIFRSYRIVYRVNHDAKLCEIAEQNEHAFVQRD